MWYTDKVCFVVVSFGKVDGAGEEDDTNKQEEDKKTQLSHAGSQCLTKNLEALGVTRQLEDPEDPHQTDDPDDGQGRGWRGIIVFDQFCSQSDKIRQDGTEVDDVHDIFEEVHLAGGASESHEEFKGEPAYAHRFHHKEGVVEKTRWGRHVVRYVLRVGVILN